MNYLSVCSGIEAATVAWHDMGWNPVGFSEIEKFPSELLKHHYSNVTNYGDMTKFKEWNINEPVNLLVGGTPCQSFSIAGLRKGLEDPRGNLMLTYLSMADYFKPKWILWENVPGVLSSNRGHDFAALLQGLAKIGYGFAYRVLDAQYFGVPQRRRRVFVVGCLGDWRSAAKVLFESESLCRDITPSRSKGEEVTGTLTRGFGDRGCDLDQIASGGYKIDVYREADLHNYKNDESTGTLRASGGCLGGGKGYLGSDETAFTLSTTQDQQIAVGFKETTDCLTAAYGTKWNGNASSTNGSLFAKQDMRVRRLTPMECERLQGFPDNYTNIPTSNDTTRYRALGNSMAVPVMKWIGNKIEGVENGMV
jgi:DNA (cytosine-5)-methyltransferase 1